MNRRLIVMDDEPDLLELYSFILSPPPRRVEGNTALAPRLDPYELVMVESGEAALGQIQKALQEGKPLVGGFFDLRMGKGIDGIETIRRAKDLDPNLLCVIVTGHLDRSIEELHQIFGKEFDDRWDFLIKPFSHAEILQKAQNLVSNWDRRMREKEYVRKIESQQEQLARSERLAALGTLARGIGHEFGNILHTIMGRADVALESGSPEKMADALKSILTSSERAGVIVRNLQSLVKMETGREPLGLDVPLSEAFQLLGYEMKKVHVGLVQEGLGGLPVVMLNRVEITQAFLNILLNAVQAMEAKGGTLKVKAVPGPGRIAIEFHDEGIGIAPENLERIFEPLFTTRVGRGSGIGLSVSRRIVENHAGKIEVRSQPGKGSVFTVTLPLASNEGKG